MLNLLNISGWQEVYTLLTNEVNVATQCDISDRQFLKIENHSLACGC